ncbi:MAG: hypothetical protein J7J75_04205 [Euryarchaeota archaeon]|nr:hypothetical protein [Euryarchaeota archaeon]
MNKWLVVLLALPLTMAIAFGGIYAHWDDAVKINGSVSTGVFNLELSLEGYGDNESDLDVGSVSAELATENDGDDIFDGGINDKLWINISNVYPGYEAWIKFNIHNNGTIPAIVIASINCSGCPNWDTMKEWFKVEVYLEGIEDPIFVWDGHNWDYNESIGYFDADGNFVFCDTLDICYENAWYFTLHVKMIEEPNPPEGLMDQSCSFEIMFTGVQAVPQGPS